MFKARAAVDNICNLVKHQIQMNDREKIGNNTKPQSIATYKTQYNKETNYLSATLRFWQIPATPIKETENHFTQSLTSTITGANITTDDFSMGSNNSWQPSETTSQITEKPTYKEIASGSSSQITKPDHTNRPPSKIGIKQPSRFEQDMINI